MDLGRSRRGLPWSARSCRSGGRHSGLVLRSEPTPREGRGSLAGCDERIKEGREKFGQTKPKPSWLIRSGIQAGMRAFKHEPSWSAPFFINEVRCCCLLLSPAPTYRFSCTVSRAAPNVSRIRDGISLDTGSTVSCRVECKQADRVGRSQHRNHAPLHILCRSTEYIQPQSRLSGCMYESGSGSRSEMAACEAATHHVHQVPDLPLSAPSRPRPMHCSGRACGEACQPNPPRPGTLHVLARLVDMINQPFRP